MRGWGSLGVLMALGVAGCAAVDEGTPLMQLYPAAAYTYGCGTWSPSRPPSAWSVFDVPAWGTQKDSVAAVVTQFGGWMSAPFHAPKVRVAVPVGAVPWFYTRGQVNTQDVTATVADTADRRISIAVLLTDSMTTADLDHATELGATITDIWTGLNGYLAVGDDSLLPLFAALPNVKVADGSIATLICGLTAPHAPR